MITWFCGASAAAAPRAAQGDLAGRETPGRDPVERAVLAELALEAVDDGSADAATAAALARRALAWAAPHEWPAVGGAALALGRCGAGDEAAAALSGLAGTAGWAAVGAVRAELALRRDDLGLAASAAGGADAGPGAGAGMAECRSSPAMGGEDRHSATVPVRAVALLARGGTEAAAALVAGEPPAAAAHGVGAAASAAGAGAAVDPAAWLLARAAVRAAAGDLAGALGDARAAGAAGALSPAALAWRPLASGRALRLGATDEARSLAAADLHLARRFGEPRALGVALRAAGVAAGDAALLTESVAVLRTAAAPVELGWALAELGSHVRRTGERREARDSLREALDLAEHAGARALGARAREELGATGAKPRRDQTSGAGSLTPSEQRVAALAAAGRSNREIAAELFVTMRTVTTHLTHVYSKLGIEGRDGLAAALGTGADGGGGADDGDVPDSGGVPDNGDVPDNGGVPDSGGVPESGGGPAGAAGRGAPAEPGAAVLAGLDPDARGLAAAVAILGSASAVDATSLAELDAARADAAWTALTEAGVLRTAMGRLEIRDAAVAAAALAALPASAAARARSAAATLLTARGDVKAAAVHLLQAPPAGDPAAVATLRRAADTALAAGDPVRAARLLRRALAEPPPPGEHAEVLRAAGEAGRLARDPRAVPTLHEALAPLGGEARAPVAAALAEALWHAGALDDAWATADAAVADLGAEADPALLAPLESLRACAVLLGHPGREHLAQRIDRLRSLAIAAGDQRTGLAAVERFWRWAAGEDAPSRPFGQAHALPAAAAVDHDAAAMLILAERVGRDDVAGAELLLTALAEEAVRTGAVAPRLHTRLWGSRLALRCGRAAAALADARTAAAVARDHDVGAFAPLAAATLADALLARGALDGALAALDAATPDGRTPPAVAAFAASSRGRVLLACGRRGEAVAVLHAGLEAARGLFAEDPNVLALRSELALALAPDDPGAAARLVDEELALARARRRPRAIGVALHARARLEPPDAAAATLAEALMTLQLAPAPLERAAVLADLGGPDRLRDAAALALEGGATALATTVLDRLLAVA